MKAVNQTQGRTETYAYNLVEIMLALVVIIVGVVGVMTLFPVSQDANKASVGNTSAADAGDQFVRVIASKLKVNWELSTALPMSKPESDESGVSFSAADAGGTIHTIKGVTLSYDDADGDGNFDYNADGGDVDGGGFFLLVQNTDTNVEDFSSVVRVWRTAATYRYYNAATGTWSVKAVPSSSGIKLNVELSYPSQLPYSERQKRHFTLNVFRPLENPASGYIFAGNLTALNINLPPSYDLEGTININPNNAQGGENPEFTMTLPDGSEVTRDDLMVSSYKGYTGQAVSVMVRPKGAGNQNGLTLNGVGVSVENSHGYHINAENGYMTVKLYKSQGNGNGTAANGGAGQGTTMGSWYITIKARNSVMTEVF